MSLHIHHLPGCAPDPLAHYLKGLGIHRLIATQADPQARGWWKDETFHLATTLDPEALRDFFLTTYVPTPLLSPWNKGSGLLRADDPAVSALENSNASRFNAFRFGIAASRQLTEQISFADAVICAIKDRTKTNISFQTEEQRALLRSSHVFISYIEELRDQLDDPARSAEIESEIAEVSALVVETDHPPTKSRANQLKQTNQAINQSTPSIKST